jgi:hypothetical protein
MTYPPTAAVTPQALAHAYRQGERAFFACRPYDANPYPSPYPPTDLARIRTRDVTTEHDAWARGYGNALADYESETARLDNLGY